jgi:hypothetical protein
MRKSEKLNDRKPPLFQSDQVIDKSIKKCHPAICGYWNLITYIKPSGEKYTVTTIKCIKCSRIGSNLYKKSKKKQQKYSERTTGTGINTKREKSKKYHNGDSCLKHNYSMRLTRQGYAMSPTHSSTKTKNKKSPSHKSYSSSEKSPCENSNYAKITRHGYNISPTHSSTKTKNKKSPSSQSSQKYNRYFMQSSQL